MDIQDPSISFSYVVLSAAQAKTVDELLRKFDESVRSLPLDPEGLDFCGDSGFRPLPPDAIVVSDVANNVLCRTTRYCYVEFHWIPILDRQGELDLSSLFGFLKGIALEAKPASVIEKPETES